MVSDRSDVRSPCVVRADMDNRSRTTSFDQNLVVVTHDCVIGGYTSGVLSPDVWVLVMVDVYGSTAKHACYDITDHESGQLLPPEGGSLLDLSPVHCIISDTGPVAGMLYIS